MATLEELKNKKIKLESEIAANETNIKNFSETFAKKYFKLLPKTMGNTVSMENHIMQIAKGNFYIEKIKQFIKMVEFMIENPTIISERKIYGSCGYYYNNDLEDKKTLWLGDGNTSPIKTGFLKQNYYGQPPFNAPCKNGESEIKIANLEEAKMWLELMKELVEI